MTRDISDRSAVVTGGSKGIGRAVATSLVDSGVDVLICARDPAEIEQAASELSERGGGTAVAVECDMRRHTDVQRMIATAVERFGRIDILVNNAGVGAFAPMGELTPDMWHRVVETNLNGVYYACHEAIPHMVAQGSGWIINIGSLAGKNPFAGGAAYNASKFGLLGFSEAMMLDLRDKGIRVSCIMPGSVQTEFSNPETGGEWKLQPEDIAEMVVDLLSFHSRALPSRVEMRPSRPPKKG